MYIILFDLFKINILEKKMIDKFLFDLFKILKLINLKHV
jgi:hypothetical protein